MYAKENEADVIFCGHTHQTLYKKIPDIEYFNTSCWTDIPSSYVFIDNKGKIEVLLSENP